MTTIQERLQLKRAPVDKWTTREKLCLASAVSTSGDQNWMNVSRSLKLLCNNTIRPADWYSQKSCAAQYGDLLENADTPKRKKRTNSESAVTPTEAVLKRFTDERISELRIQIQKDQEEYAKLNEEIDALENGNLSDAQLMEMWKKIEAEQVQKIIDQEKYVQMLKDREEKKLEMQRQWKPTIQINKAAIAASTSKTEVEDMDIDESITAQTLPQTPSSPLLTSLLKSGQGQPASVTSPTITHLLTGGIPSSQSTAPRTVSVVPFPESGPQKPSVAQTPSQTAPTLSMLLEKKEETTVTSSGNESPNKDEEQQLLEEFNGLIPDNIDELAEMITKNSNIILEGEEGLDNVLLEDDASGSPAVPKEDSSENKIKTDEEERKEVIKIENTEEMEPKTEEPETISSDESSDNTNLQTLKDKAKSEENLMKEEAKEEEEIKEEPIKTENDDVIEIPIDMKPDDPEAMLEMIHQSPEPDHSGKPDQREEEESAPSQPSKLVRKVKERSESPMDDDGATDSSTSFRSRRRYSSTPVNDSHPNSPVPSSFDDKETKAFKKSMFLLCTRLEKSKYSGVFMKATPDGSLEDIVKWKNVCLKLLDLPTLRKNVESGHTKTTAEFFRDIYVMCYNSIFFFRENHRSSRGTHNQAVKFLEEVRDLEKESKEGKSVEKEIKEKVYSSSTSSSTGSSSKSRNRKSRF
ncbi:BRD8 family protein [Megaselia abdita]